MVTRKGFTLIELLIVVTIIAILAGAAIPYVQDYVEQSRSARVKNDLDEVRNAIVLYELTRRVPYTSSTTAPLVGPFLSKPISDAWGAPYVVNSASSTAYSIGPDGVDGSGDEITVNVRPPMAVTKVLWFDTNQDGLANVPDSIHVYCTRPIATYTAALPGGKKETAGLTLTGTAFAAGNFGELMTASTTIASFPLAGPITPGKDTLTIDFATVFADTDGVWDESKYNFKAVKNDVLKVLAP